MFVVGLAVLAYTRIIVPSSFDLSLDFEVKAPVGLSVEIDHSHSVAPRVRPDPYEWEIAIKAMVTNKTGSPAFVPTPKIALHEPGGKRVPLREPFVDNLFANSGTAMLQPGETRVYKTPVPIRIRAKSGKRRVRATIGFK